MRRRDREITDIHKIKEIMSRCDCVRLGFTDAKGMYIVPLNFGFTETNGRFFLYCHGALHGRKVDCIRDSGRAAFEMDVRHKLVVGQEACQYSYLYESIIGEGKIEILQDREAKRAALDVIMSHYGEGPWEYREEIFESVAVLKLEAAYLTCKANS